MYDPDDDWVSLEYRQMSPERRSYNKFKRELTEQIMSFPTIPFEELAHFLYRLQHMLIQYNIQTTGKYKGKRTIPGKEAKDLVERRGCRNIFDFR